MLFEIEMPKIFRKKGETPEEILEQKNKGFMGMGFIGIFFEWDGGEGRPVSAGSTHRCPREGAVARGPWDALNPESRR